jgi:Ser/Thr protein kinase RdoA (MazF antagonist)
MDNDVDPPFAGLTPDRILDALEGLGLACDGRLLALNSYENRVYQVGIEDAAPLVAKFYRPARWSDAAILEEHGFVAELAAREIPAVPALAFAGKTLHQAGSKSGGMKSWASSQSRGSSPKLAMSSVGRCR